MIKAIIYTTKICPYCDQAKEILRNAGIDFTEYDVGTDIVARQRMSVETNGARTVPQIFIEGRYIGGCDDLRAFKASGELDKLIKGE